MYTQSDRRVFRRIKGKIPVLYRVLGGTREHRSFTKNIGAGGMRIPIFKIMAPGTVLDLEIFKNNSNGSARCKGEIIWTGRMTTKGKGGKIFEAGVRFLDLNFLFIGNLIGDLEARKLSGAQS